MCCCGNDDKCCSAHCNKCCGLMLGLLGVLILLNIFVWPMWLGIDGWMGFFAVLMIFAGVWKSFVASTACDVSEKESKKKK